MKKNKKKLSIIRIIMISVISILLGFATQLMPDIKKQIIDFAEGYLGISYTLFWIICVIIIVSISIFLFWKQAKNEKDLPKEESKNINISIPNSENGIKNLKELVYTNNQGEKTQTSIRKFLTSDPINPYDIIGRDKDLNALRKKLLSGKENVLLLVNGKGGIGKTTLAAHYYHCFKHEYQHMAWVLSKKSIINSLLDLSFTLKIRFEKNQSYKEKLEILLTKLTNLKKPCLLVIDNANEINDLESSCLALSKCSNFHILLTTRITYFENAPFFKINGLKEKYAIKLFKKHYPAHDSSEDDLLKQIIADIEKNTLIIEILAKNLKTINELEHKYSLTQLHKDINKSLIALSKSNKISTLYCAKGTGLRKESPEAIVLAMYDLRKLSKAEKQMISIFAVLPNEAILFQHLKALSPDLITIENTVLKLAQKGWIDFNEQAKSFKINQVVQDVVKEIQKHRLPSDCIDLINNIIKYLSKDNILYYKQIDHTLLLVQYAESILTAIKINTIELGILSQYIGYFHMQTGDLLRSLSAYKKMSAIFSKLLNNNKDNPDFKNGLAISYLKLGSTHTALGNLDQALIFFKDYLKLRKELYKAYPENVSFKNGLAISYSKLGSTHTELGNLDQALKFFEDCLKLYKELYEAYPQNVSFKNGLAVAYAKLGVFFRDQNHDKNNAQIYFEKAQKLLSELVKQAPKHVTFQKYFEIVQKDLNDL